ncbi:MAG: hypothetical protein KDD73_02675 [Anaerolineales bacterium]|nr:hypothetical protein [Anaerolineales bacterium]MCB9127764.1 hypothetical protein [Ardenticatenales bacterium]
MLFDVPTVIAIIMLLASVMSTRMGQRRSRSLWRSSYAVIALSLLHLAFLYQFFGPTLGRFGSESWAGITAAAIAGIAADDDADAVGLLLVVLGVVQLLLLAGVLNLRAL